MSQRNDRFAGFPARGLAFTPVPDLFFTRLLPLVDDLPELKVTLHLFWLVHQKKGPARLVRWEELLADRTLLGGLGSADGAAEALAAALERAVARGTVLHVQLEVPSGLENLYAPNTGEGRVAVERLKAGKLNLPPPPRVLAPVRAAPLSALEAFYEQHIGLLSPLVAAELAESEREYGAAAVEAAIREAERLGKPRWAYIKRVLENQQQRRAGGVTSDGQEG